METQSIFPKLKQSGIANELAISTSTLQRYRREMNMFSPCRIPTSSSNTNTIKQKTSNHTEHDLEATSNDLEMTSNELKMTSKNGNGKKVKSRKNLRGTDPNDDNPFSGRDLIEEFFLHKKWPSL